MGRRIRFCQVLLFVSLVLPTEAQVIPYTGIDRPWEPRITFERITTGVAELGWRVEVAAQDDAGYLWFGSRNGLSRYDGHDFTHFFRDATNPLSPDTDWISLGALYKDEDGTLWIGANDGLEHFDPIREQVIARYRHDATDSTSIPSNIVSTFLKDTAGRYWVGTRQGMARLDPVTGRFTRFPHRPEADDSPTPGLITSLVEDIDGTLWFGTVVLGRDWGDRYPVYGGGLNHFDPATGRTRRYGRNETPGGLQRDHVSALLVDRRGTLWIGSWGNDGLHRYDRENDRVVHIAYDPNHPERLSAPRQQDDLIKMDDPEGAGISFFFEDSSGILWIGGMLSGINRYDPFTGAVQHFEYIPGDPTSLGADDVRGMIETRDGVKWVLTWDGIFRVNTQADRFHFYSTEPGAPNAPSDSRIVSMFEDSQGQVWIGMLTGGLRMLDRKSGRSMLFAHDPAQPASLSFNFVSQVTERPGSPDELWISTLGGNNRVYRGVWAFEHASHNPRQSPMLTKEPFGSFTWQSPDQAWVILWGGGVLDCSMETELCERMPLGAGPDSLNDGFVTAILQASDKTLWVGTRAGGLYEIRDERPRKAHFVEDVAFQNFITDIAETPDGRLWVSSVYGLHRRNEEGLWERLSTEDGLPSDIIFHLFLHGSNELWMSTARGLAFVDLSTGRIQHYTGPSEFRKNHFFVNSIHQTPNGEIFLGGLNGFLVFHPDRVKYLENRVPPEVVIESATSLVDGDGVHPHPSGVSMRYRERDVTFGYVGLHYVRPENVRYRYRLDGYDTDWIDAGSQRSVRYPRLPDGDFTFRVRAANPDGYWSEDATFDFTVLPPWWRHPLAYIAYALLIAGLVYAANRAQRERLIQRERLAAAQDRTRLVEALDQTKTRFFVNLSHEFRTPLTLLLGPIRDALDGAYGELNPRMRAQLDPMHRAADRLHHMINQLLDLAKLEAGSMQLQARAGDLVAFVRAITLAFASRAEREQKTLRFDASMERLAVSFDPDKLEKILYNLLSNAFKFTDAGGKIRVSVGQVEAEARVIVRDTGIGIPAKELPHIFDRFHQADASPTRRHEGSGIGLALAKELAELHRGRLTVESEEGFGSTFTLALPLSGVDGAVGADGEGAPGSTPATASGVDGGEVANSPSASWVDEVADMRPDGLSGSTPATRAHASSTQPVPTILLVEDNADVRAYLKSHLTAYKVLEAEDGEAGLALALAEMPDLVISDVMMPKLDGYDLCAALKKDRRTRDIPVVLLTAKAAEEDKIEGLATGADDYLYKPFSARELLARVDNLIRRNRELKAKYRQEVVLKPTEITVTPADVLWLEKVRAIVEAHLGDSQFGVERLAEEVGLGRRQLQRKLNELTGHPAHRFIQESRLEQARKLLEQKAGNVSEIAYRVGFRDARHFSRLFLQRFGKPPSQWP